MVIEGNTKGADVRDVTMRQSTINMASTPQLNDGAIEGSNDTPAVQDLMGDVIGTVV